MICQECKDSGQKSRVTSNGHSMTLMGWHPYWDEEGVYHSHNPNARTTDYQCSRGHRWIVKSVDDCPAGDYGNDS